MVLHAHAPRHMLLAGAVAVLSLVSAHAAGLDRREVGSLAPTQDVRGVVQMALDNFIAEQEQLANQFQTTQDRCSSELKHSATALFNAEHQSEEALQFDANIDKVKARALHLQQQHVDQRLEALIKDLKATEGELRRATQGDAAHESEAQQEVEVAANLAQGGSATAFLQVEEEPATQTYAHQRGLAVAAALLRDIDVMLTIHRRAAHREDSYVEDALGDDHMMLSDRVQSLKRSVELAEEEVHNLQAQHDLRVKERDTQMSLAEERAKLVRNLKTQHALMSKVCELERFIYQQQSERRTLIINKLSNTVKLVSSSDGALERTVLEAIREDKANDVEEEEGRARIRAMAAELALLRAEAQALHARRHAPEFVDFFATGATGTAHLDAADAITKDLDRVHAASNGEGPAELVIDGELAHSSGVATADAPAAQATGASDAGCSAEELAAAAEKARTEEREKAKVALEAMLPEVQEPVAAKEAEAPARVAAAKAAPSTVGDAMLAADAATKRSEGLTQHLREQEATVSNLHNQVAQARTERKAFQERAASIKAEIEARRSALEVARQVATEAKNKRESLVELHNQRTNERADKLARAAALRKLIDRAHAITATGAEAAAGPTFLQADSLDAIIADASALDVDVAVSSSSDLVSVLDLAAQADEKDAAELDLETSRLSAQIRAEELEVAEKEAEVARLTLLLESDEKTVESTMFALDQLDEHVQQLEETLATTDASVSRISKELTEAELEASAMGLLASELLRGGAELAPTPTGGATGGQEAEAATAGSEADAATAGAEADAATAGAEAELEPSAATAAATGATEVAGSEVAATASADEPLAEAAATGPSQTGGAQAEAEAEEEAKEQARAEAEADAEEQARAEAEAKTEEEARAKAAAEAEAEAEAKAQAEAEEEAKAQAKAEAEAEAERLKKEHEAYEASLQLQRELEEMTMEEAQEIVDNMSGAMTAIANAPSAEVAGTLAKKYSPERYDRALALLSHSNKEVNVVEHPPAATMLATGAAETAEGVASSSPALEESRATGSAGPASATGVAAEELAAAEEAAPAITAATSSTGSASSGNSVDEHVAEVSDLSDLEAALRRLDATRSITMPGAELAPIPSTPTGGADALPEAEGEQEAREAAEAVSADLDEELSTVVEEVTHSEGSAHSSTGAEEQAQAVEAQAEAVQDMVQEALTNPDFSLADAVKAQEAIEEAGTQGEAQPETLELSVLKLPESLNELAAATAAHEEVKEEVAPPTPEEPAPEEEEEEEVVEDKKHSLLEGGLKLPEDLFSRDSEWDESSAAAEIAASSPVHPSKDGAVGILRFAGHSKERDLCAMLSGSENQFTDASSGRLQVWHVHDEHQNAQHWRYSTDGSLCLEAHPDYCLIADAEGEALRVDARPSTKGLRGADPAKWVLDEAGRVRMAARPDLCLHVAGKGAIEHSSDVILASASDTEASQQLWLFDVESI